MEKKNLKIVTTDNLTRVVQSYASRSFDEELQALETLLGVEENHSLRLCQLLGTSRRNGLNSSDSQDIQKRRTIFDTNELPSRPPTPFWRLLLAASDDFVLRILIIAGIVSLILGLSFGEKKEIDWIEGSAIFLAVIIVVLVTAGNDWAKERRFAKLFLSDKKYTSVIRNGKLNKIETEELVVGDIVHLETGDEIPADAIILSGQDLSVNESSLTGENDSVTKQPLDDCLKFRADYLKSMEPSTLMPTNVPSCGPKHHIIPSPVILAGTTILRGDARAVIICVGSNSQSGQLLRKLVVDTEPTPLQNKLNALAKNIGNMGLTVASIVFFILLANFWITYIVSEEIRNSYTSKTTIYAHIQMLVQAITILVVAVPEGLPLAVTVSLAFSVERMLKDQNYVRRLAACEIMGGASEICSDKTGTLTTNKMKVEAFWNGSRLAEANDNTKCVSTSLSHIQWLPAMPAQFMKILYEAIAINSTAYIDESIPEKISGRQDISVSLIKHVGSATECALLQLLLDMGQTYADLRNTIGSEENVVFRLGFDSKRKMMTTVIKCPDNKNLLRVYVKGASEIVLKLCNYRIDSAGCIRVMEKYHRQKVEKQIIDYLGSLAYRTVCIGYKDFDPIEEPNWKEQLTLEEYGPYFDQYSTLKPKSNSQKTQYTIYRMEFKLICLGIAGMRDPLRDEVPAAVRKCQSAGIKVRMVTGDNIDTAKQIALTCNIYKPELGGIAMAGADFYKAVGGVLCAECRTEVCDCPINSFMNRKLPKRLSSIKTLNSQGEVGFLATRLLSEASPNTNKGSFSPGDGSSYLRQSIESFDRRDFRALKGSRTSLPILQPKIEINDRKRLSSFIVKFMRKKSDKVQKDPETPLLNKSDHLPFPLAEPNSNDQKNSLNLQSINSVIQSSNNLELHSPSINIKQSQIPSYTAKNKNMLLQTVSSCPNVKTLTNVTTNYILTEENPNNHFDELKIKDTSKTFSIPENETFNVDQTYKNKPSTAVKIGTINSERKLRRDVVGDLDAFARIVPNLEVLARSQPQDKYALVLGLKELGSVVAVTGDGVNDAPALKKADVGFAMGLTGKEVTKQAADIVILDDNFESIVCAVKWGRSIYDNIRRFLQFQITVNLVAVIIALVGSIVIKESPLTAVQLLWINLVMDTIASLALATQPATDDLLQLPPHSRNEYLIDKLMTRNILGQAAYQLFVMLTLIFTGECWIPESSSQLYALKQGFKGFTETSTTCGNGHTIRSGRRFFPFSQQQDYLREWTLNVGPSRHYTIVFNVFVWLQLFNLINSRKVRNELNVFSGILLNKLWLIMFSIIVVLQVVLIQFGGYALNSHFEGLSLNQWLLCIALGAGSLVVGFFIHLLPADKLTFLPQTGNKEESIENYKWNLALASRGRISTEKISTRLAAGLHNESKIVSDYIKKTYSQEKSSL